MQRLGLLCLLFFEVLLIAAAIVLRRFAFPQWMMLEDTLFNFERGAIAFTACSYAAASSWDKNARKVTSGAFFFVTFVAIVCDTVRLVYQFLIFNYGWNPRGFDVPPGQIASYWEYAKFGILGLAWLLTALFILSGLLDTDGDSVEPAHQRVRLTQVPVQQAYQPTAPVQRLAAPPGVQVNVMGQGMSMGPLRPVQPSFWPSQVQYQQPQPQLQPPPQMYVESYAL